MEEKKILTDEELDNVVGGKLAREARGAYRHESVNIGLTNGKNESLVDPAGMFARYRSNKRWK